MKTILAAVQKRLEISSTANKTTVNQVKQIILKAYPTAEVILDNGNNVAFGAKESFRNIDSVLQKAGMDVSGFTRWKFFEYKDVKGSIRYLHQLPDAKTKYTSGITVSFSPFVKEERQEKEEQKKLQEQRNKKYLQVREKLMPIFKTWGTVKEGAFTYILTPLKITESNLRLINAELEKTGFKQESKREWSYDGVLQLTVEKSPQRLVYNLNATRGNFIIEVSNGYYS